MTPSQEYPIEVYMMTENRCYQSGKRIAPIGIQVHSVGCKGTDRDRWRKWNNPSIDKCANAILDTQGIMQTLPWDYRPWLSGAGSLGKANDYMVGFEMCEPLTVEDTPDTAKYLFNCAKYLCEQLCIDYGILPGNILCHSELHRMGVASNHADVTHWWGKKGTSWEPYTMDRLRAEITVDLVGLGLPTRAEELPANRLPTVRRGFIGEEVKYLQRLLNDAGKNLAADGKFGPGTEAAVKEFQKANGLSADGVAGGKTWSALITGKRPLPDTPELPDDDDNIPEIPALPPESGSERPDGDGGQFIRLPIADALTLRNCLLNALNIIGQAEIGGDNNA